MTSKKNSGFTLVEVTIALAIIGVAMGVVIPSLSNTGRAAVRTEAGRLHALLRQTYNSAVLTGKTHRMLFDLGKSTITVDASEEVIMLGENGRATAPKKNKNSPDANSTLSMLGLSSELIGAKQLEFADAFTSAMEEQDSASEKPSFASLMGGGSGGYGSENNGAAEDDTTDSRFSGTDILFHLDSRVQITDIKLLGNKEPIKEGKVALYFFPHGYTQKALIHLNSTQGATAFSLIVSPLTGRVEVDASYKEVQW